MRRRGALTVFAPVLILIAGCGGGADPGPPQATVTAPPPSVTGPGTPTSEPQAAKRVQVPKVVGMNHQEAQDLLQAAGFYMLAERDATGQDRMLVWDRNWVVVRQSPEAGTRIALDATITLYSKKIGE